MKEKTTNPQTELNSYTSRLIFARSIMIERTLILAVYCLNHYDEIKAADVLEDNLALLNTMVSKLFDDETRDKLELTNENMIHFVEGITNAGNKFKQLRLKVMKIRKQNPKLYS